MPSAIHVFYFFGNGSIYSGQMPQKPEGVIVFRRIVGVGRQSERINGGVFTPILRSEVLQAGEGDCEVAACVLGLGSS